MEIEFFVSVSVERESGLNASRDDITEKIAEALAEAAEQAELSDLGARGDSVYSVEGADVRAVDKIKLRALRKEYEDAVRAEEPSDQELRNDLKAANNRLRQAQADLASARRQLAEIAEKKAETATRVWMGSTWDEAGRTYLPDGKWDHIHFQFGDRDTERFTFGFDGREKSIEIRTDSAFGFIAALPISGNVLRIAMVDRD